MNGDLLEKYLSELKSSSCEPDDTDVILLERMMSEYTKLRRSRARAKFLAAVASTFVIVTSGFVLAGGPQVVRKLFVRIDVVDPDRPLPVLQVSDESGVVGEITVVGGGDEGPESPSINLENETRSDSSVHVDVIDAEKNRLQISNGNGNAIGEIEVIGSADGNEGTGTDED